jgi:succinyl-diaminopimelate desuccinylase
MTESGSREVPDLLALTAEIVGIPSVSHDEAALADAVESDLSSVSWLTVERIGDTVVARTDLGRPSRLILAGHLDTVPGSGDVAARIEGDRVYGLGSADMKGGVAIFLALAATIDAPSKDVTYIFYPCEEVSRADNGLVALADSRPDLLAADAAILGEPTSALVEAGCQGTLRAVAKFAGKRAHSARPFAGVNAIHRAAGLLDLLVAYASRHVVLDGCEYAEQLQAVGIEGGIAWNVVPDQASVRINFRFAPDRDAQQAIEEMRSITARAIDKSAGDSLEILESMHGAPPSLDQPILAQLVCESGGEPRAKVGWTDVATFWEHGIPAANFGPADPLLAHTANEFVTRTDLERAYGVLARVLLT